MNVKECVSMISLGCPKNLVDTEVMLGSLIEEGYRISQREEEAEVIIVNTCGFIEEAKKESIETILELAELKKNGNCRILVVAGCLPQRYKDDLIEELPEVDLFIGTGEFQKVVEILDRFKRSTNPPRRYIDEPRFIYSDKTPRLNTYGVSSAYVKIAEGCSNSCSYCVIGKIRGRFRSRSLHSIVREVENLVKMGVKEINIIGQDTTQYGRDLSPTTNLGELLRELAKVKELEWIRILYTHPAYFTEDLVQVIKEEEKICNYIDLPVQHINDRMLKAMNRKTTGSLIRKLIEKLRREVPGICIRTSLIVGFPGETDEEFEELLEFVKEVKFDRLGAFEYSREEGTLASSYPGQIREGIKKERYMRLMEVQKGIALENNQKIIGSSIKVLTEGVSEENGLVKGRTPYQAPEIDGVTYITQGKAGAGQIHDVFIADADEYDLIGKISSPISSSVKYFNPQNT